MRPASSRPSVTGRALLAVTLSLVAFGLISVYSASSYVAHTQGLEDSHYLFQQLSRAGIGLVVLAVASVVNYRLYQGLAWPLLGLTILLLIVLLLPGTESISPRINGARRWLDLGVTMQPSELAKISVVLWTAAVAVKKQDRLHSFLISAAALPAVWVQVMGNGYRLARVAAFMNPDSTAAAGGYQLKQSLMAVGSGGMFGVGFGRSSLKMSYLPEPQNDFIFSIIAEEWGFVGAAAVIVLFLAWALLGLRISRAAPDLYGRLVAVGITALVAFAAFGHIGVALGLLPTTGINLPFISAGGTNLILMLGTTGILLNVSKGGRA
jgi:cell division protein FtsW